MKVTDEMLMSLADGELDADTAADLRRAVGADPALQWKLAAFEATRAAAKSAFAETLAEPVPERLLATLSPQRTRPSPRLPRWLQFGGVGGLALAGAAAGFLVAVWLGSPSATLLTIDPTLRQLLETAPSGQTLAWNGGQFQATGTYVVTDGPCRTFAASPGEGATGWRGVACRHGSSWQIDLAVSEPAAAFTTASGRATVAVDAFLDAAGAGTSLDLAAEAELRAAGWRSP
jgi:hypothetical protein